MKTIRRQYRKCPICIFDAAQGFYGNVKLPNGTLISSSLRNDEDSVKLQLENEVDDYFRTNAGIKCMVAAANANGESDFYFVIVKGTEAQLAEGDHLTTAENAATAAGYEAPFVTFDENEPAGRALIEANLFVWESASIIHI
jgi:paraquat-inducible protein B